MNNTALLRARERHQRKTRLGERDLNALWGNAVDVIKQLLETTKSRTNLYQRLEHFSPRQSGVYLLDKEGQNLGHGIMSSDSLTAYR
ncbi:hypothetical protein O9993_11920 [Vibrio lentus]|nr:hypothetical protein [Vibrio lentus]